MKLENNMDEPMSFDDFMRYICREGPPLSDDLDDLGLPKNVPKPSISKYDLSQMWTEKDAD